MTEAELKALTECALREAYSSQILTLYNVLSSKILTARGSNDTDEAARQFQKGLQLAKDTYFTASKAL